LRIDPDPDFGRIECVLRRQGEPDRVPLFELFSNIQDEVLQAIGRHVDPPPAGAADTARVDWELEQHAAYMLALGYDYINVRAGNFRFPQAERPTAMTAQGTRGYLLGSTHTIENRRDFEAYDWPDVSAIDLRAFERAPRFLPPGMKVITMGPGGILENVMWLLGYEGASYLLYDDEPLVRDMFEAVATRIIAYFDRVASLDVVGAVVLGDDMGFKTQTLLSPEVYREHLFPWYRKLIATVHSHGKPAILHACGNLKEVMPDLISCGWDARHSFEDAIQPVWEAKAAYGNDIALLGGFDMDKICRLSHAEIRTHTRYLIQQCAPGGGWALGTGNSVANYVPVDSFLTMQEEGYLAGSYG